MILCAGLLVRFLPSLTSSEPPISRTAAGLAGGQGFTKVEEECGDGVNGGQCESAPPLKKNPRQLGEYIGERSARMERDHAIKPLPSLHFFFPKKNLYGPCGCAYGLYAPLFCDNRLLLI
jgi:hypothetical protein